MLQTRVISYTFPFFLNQENVCNTNYIQFLKYIITSSHFISILILFTMVILISWKTSSPTMPQPILPPPHPFPQIIFKFPWQVLNLYCYREQSFLYVMGAQQMVTNDTYTF